MQCEEANKIDITEYLAKINVYPCRVDGDKHWYISPLRQPAEKTASFCVSTHWNNWIDWGGDGKSASLVTLGTKLHGCSVSDFLRMLSAGRFTSIAQQPLIKKENPLSQNEARVLKAGAITMPYLKYYLAERAIPFDMGAYYFKQITFELTKTPGKLYYALGLENRSGGFALRNKYYKGATKPNDITFIDNKAPIIDLHEGSFSFVSELVGRKTISDKNYNHLILNSASMKEHAFSTLEQYEKIRYFGDNDNTGNRLYQELAVRFKVRLQDCRSLYQPCKDRNVWLIRQNEVKRPQISLQQH